MELTDEQWAVLEPLIGAMPRRTDGRGRPWRSSRDVLNGILWILRTSAQWADLPDRYPPYQTCHRRYHRWVREGLFERILEALAADLRERGGLDLSECFIDGTFIVAKQGADAWIRPSGGKVRSSWQWRRGRPLWSASRRLCRLGFARAESRLLAPTLDSRCVAELPQRLIGDRAYAADPLDIELAKLGVEMIAPHRRNRKQPKTQDGRALRRYTRRWKIERLFAWLGNFRRLVVR